MSESQVIDTSCRICGGQKKRRGTLCQSCYDTRVCEIGCNKCNYVSNNYSEYNLHLSMDHNKCMFCPEQCSHKHLLLSHFEKLPDFKGRVNEWVNDHTSKPDS